MSCECELLETSDILCAGVGTSCVYMCMSKRGTSRVCMCMSSRGTLCMCAREWRRPKTGDKVGTRTRRSRGSVVAVTQVWEEVTFLPSDDDDEKGENVRTSTTSATTATAVAATTATATAATATTVAKYFVIRKTLKCAFSMNCPTIVNENSFNWIEFKASRSNLRFTMNSSRLLISHAHLCLLLKLKQHEDYDAVGAGGSRVVIEDGSSTERSRVQLMWVAITALPLRPEK